jgi:hypothetical protein
MSYTLRNYRHRNPKGGDEKKTASPFFRSIQRLATSKEDEKLATNDARMEKDKEEPQKPVQLTDKPGEEKKKKKPAGAGSDVKKTGKKKAGGKEKEKEKPVQRKEKRTTSDEVEHAIGEEAGKGSALHPDVLAEMNQAFGVDLSDVRVHYDVAAAALCTELNAEAFTHGHEIYFGEGKYNPHSAEGKKLLAHELTHVVQQSNQTYYDHS